MQLGELQLLVERVLTLIHHEKWVHRQTRRSAVSE